MKKIRSRVGLCTLILLLFIVGLGILLISYFRNARKWFLTPYNRHLYTADNALMSGTIVDRNGVLLSYAADGVRRFSDDAATRLATLHVVGDAEGKIGTSALSTMRDYLVNFTPAIGVSSVTEKGNTVALSIDANLNRVAYDALAGRNGTVCVYNRKTGEILALVSTPVFDPADIPADLEQNAAYEGAYINRFYSSTATPGSVMKTVILQAALEQLTASDIDSAQTGPIENCIFRCDGHFELPDGTVNCTAKHGAQTLSEAFANSCNCVFAQLAVALSPDTVSAYTNKAGLTASYKIGSVSTARGVFEFSGIPQFRLGYAGIGLYHDQVNPCSLLVYYAAIAEGGSAAIPTTLLSAADTGGNVFYRPTTSFSPVLIEKNTAATIRKMLENNVVKTYGADRFPCKIAAKSGTISRGNGKSDCWFAGFTAEDRLPYAFVVYIEHGGSGSADAGDVAAKVLRALCGSSGK